MLRTNIYGRCRLLYGKQYSFFFQGPNGPSLKRGPIGHMILMAFLKQLPNHPNHSTHNQSKTMTGKFILLFNIIKNLLPLNPNGYKKKKILNTLNLVYNNSVYMDWAGGGGRGLEKGTDI